MSEKTVQWMAIVCDGCGLEMDEHPEPRELVVDSDSKLIVLVHFPKDKDFCDKCQIAAIGKAAHICGAVKTRDLAAHQPPVDGTIYTSAGGVALMHIPTESNMTGTFPLQSPSKEPETSSEPEEKP